jgi:predicted pyridoxine 5'-phosphate oxidase superfamily flavin-nucleotide-binding protein
MGSLYDVIDARMGKFIRTQPVFFVATAPLDASGHVNCSPKGNDGAFAVLGERRVAYLDFTGSGIETIAHLKENGRIVVMFCAFGGPPRIVRLHGRGEVVPLGDPRFDELLVHFESRSGARAVIVVDVERISDSCGYGVPVMDFQRHRDNLDHWVETKGGEPGLIAYRAEKNALSVDGLPGYGSGAEVLPG